uniref:Uncharacterized protein n=1 Tax=Oryza brachyantha TaxID=4533 RepID=J3LAB3_ORYBR
MISLAASADDATTTGTSPSLSDMSGAPSRRAMSAMVRCTSGPRAMTWCRFPTTGSRHGPGGSLSPPLPPRFVVVNLKATRPSKRKQRHHTTFSMASMAMANTEHSMASTYIDESLW